MKFTPKTDEELNAESLLAAGVYSFEVINAENKTSQNGNEMIMLALQIFDHDGNHAQRLNDYLLEKLAYKLKHAAEACGLLDEYQRGDLQAEWFIGKTGQVKIGIEPAKGDYQARNSVKDYVVKKDGSVSDHAAAKGNGFAPEPAPLNDIVPFALLFAIGLAALQMVA